MTFADIFHYSRNIGKLSFNPTESFTICNSNAHVIEFRICAFIDLKITHEGNKPVLSNINGTIIGKRDSVDPGYQLGHFDSPEIFIAPFNNIPIDFSWRVSIPELLSFESYRNGLPPMFQLNLFALTFWYTAIADNKFAQSLPERFVQRFILQVPHEVWGKLLSKLRLHEYMLMQLPWPPPNPDTKDIRVSLERAISAFYKGGSNGWAECVSCVRIALEKLDKSIDGGNAFKNPIGKSKADMEAWSKTDRIKNLAWSLKHISHIPHHDDGDYWSRDESLLCLTNAMLLTNLLLPPNEGI